MTGDDLIRLEREVQALVDAAMECIRSDLTLAARHARRARRLADRAGSDLAIGQSERVLGHVQLLAGRARRALPHYEAAQLAFAELPAERAATAVAMLQALAYASRYARAFEVAADALSYFDSVGDTLRAARVRANLANALHRQDRLAEARVEYERALAVLEREGSPQDVAIVYRNFGVCLMGLLDFDAAQTLYARARTVFESNALTSLISEVELNQTYLLGRQGYLREALVTYRRLRDDLPEALGFELGHCLLDQADFLLHAGLWTDARLAASRAGETFARLQAGFERGKAHLLEGWSLVRLGQLREARGHLQDARRRLRQEPNRNWQALAQLAWSEWYEADGQLAAAYRAAVDADSGLASPERVAEIRHRRLRLALALPARSQPTVWLRNAMQSADVPPGLRVAYARRSPNVSAEAAEETARAALAHYDAARNAQANVHLRRAFVDAHEYDLRQCFRALRRPEDRLMTALRLKQLALAELRESPESAPPDPQLTALRAAWGQASGDARARLEADISARWREWRQALESQSWPSLTLPTVPPDACVIELLADDGALFAFTISPGAEVREVRLGSVREWRDLARYLRLQLTRRDGAAPDQARRLLAALGERLGPIVPPPGTAVAIAPDRTLGVVPWHAIPVEAEPWGERGPLTLIPSAALAVAPTPRVPANDPPCVVAAPDAMAPEIQREADAIARMFGVTVRRAFRPDAVGEPRFLHLAAHGIAREDHPLLSAMRLGEGELSVFDVLQNRLRAPLATLSGCSTGVSSGMDTSDASGFIEAFLVAGTPRVVASLWDVHDAAAVVWMEAFYAALAESPVHAAFATANRTCREQFPHPQHWAAFAVFGPVFSDDGAVGPHRVTMPQE
ncbi:MAG: CHAT domain-containing tetratricopeptide repeat protein [Fimbriimonadaceae bacterium]|nr:CHAT domain-containing tetratricopeptide repeat protein [Fimbriimonadaceae bacterium]